LQGALFKKLHDHIMNLAPSSAYHSNNSGHRSVLKPKSSAPNSGDVSVVTSPPRSYKEALMGSQPPTK
jgi:hypothetical protein